MTGDYTEPFGNAESSICAALERRGFQTSVVDVSRRDWLQVAKGTILPKFWRAELTTHPGYSWYLERTRAAVHAAAAAAGGGGVVLVCHSAGGWLGRAFLGDPQWFDGAGQGRSVAGTVSATPNPLVRGLVTLGTPHVPPPVDKARDMTGGAQTWVHASFPGARFVGQGVAYVCACGRTVVGKSRDKKVQKERTIANYACSSYEQVCGEGEGIVGDAVVPLQSALLEGAEHVVLDGVFHSMSRVGTFDTDSGTVWYGSEDVVDTWLAPLVQQLEAGSAQPVDAAAAASSASV